ncbi:MAG TPA: OmpA family protein [Kofleriaceae bacterium]|jgi:outer membrane protein OmpA-like peptidoglycan-associated protein
MSRRALALLVLLALGQGAAFAQSEAPDWVPHRRRTVVTTTSITILDNLRFLPGSPLIDPATTPILDAISQTLAGNTDIKLVEIRAYAADAMPGLQWVTAQLRARNIVGYLVEHGVESERLVPRGVPLPPAGSHARFELEIVTRAP